MKLQRIVPVLYSTDITRSISYFMDKLGFDKNWEWDAPATFGGVSKGENVELFFCKENQGNPGTWLCIDVDKIDEYYDDIKSRGADIISPPGDKEWNMREMLVRTPDGHIIRFGSSLDCD